jgi:hypothetical protein
LGTPSRLSLPASRRRPRGRVPDREPEIAVFAQHDAHSDQIVAVAARSSRRIRASYASATGAASRGRGSNARDRRAPRARNRAIAQASCRRRWDARPCAGERPVARSSPHGGRRKAAVRRAQEPAAEATADAAGASEFAGSSYPEFGITGCADEEGRAARLRAAPFFARAVCARAKSLAAMPFGCKHEAESDDLEPKPTSLLVARTDGLAISARVDAFDGDTDVRADGAVIAIAPLLAGAGSHSKRETRKGCGSSGVTSERRNARICW